MESFLNFVERFTPIITIVISGLISFFVAKVNARNEIKKILLNNQREDEFAVHKAFSALMSALEEYCAYNSGFYYTAATKANSDFLSIAPKCCQTVLHEIGKALIEYDQQKVKELSKELFSIYSTHVQNPTHKSKRKR